jgi:hypothetical protein
LRALPPRSHLCRGIRHSSVPARQKLTVAPGSPQASAECAQVPEGESPEGYVKSFDGFCWKLRCAMKSSGLTRQELAERLGLKPSAIKSWVVGRRSPTVRRLLALSSVLGVAPSQLFDEPADMPVVTTCGACGQTFRRPVGHRIHIGLKAKDCPKHAALHLALPPAPTRNVDVGAA